MSEFYPAWVAHEVIKTKHKAAYDFCILPYSKLLTIEIIILSNGFIIKLKLKQIIINLKTKQWSYLKNNFNRHSKNKIIRNRKNN
jgi:uncharacterized protein YwgA